MKYTTIDVLEAEIDGSRFLQLTALRDGAVVGTATVLWLEMVGKAPELCNLFIAESARRQGIAEKLINTARKAMGCPMCLHSVRESPGYWLYRKMGFLEVGAMKEDEKSVWMLLPAY